MIQVCYRGPITQDIPQSHEEDRVERVNLKPSVPYLHCFCFPLYCRAFSSKGTGTTVVCVVVISIYTYTSPSTLEMFLPHQLVRLGWSHGCDPHNAYRGSRSCVRHVRLTLSTSDPRTEDLKARRCNTVPEFSYCDLRIEVALAYDKTRGHASAASSMKCQLHPHSKLPVIVVSTMTSVEFRAKSDVW